MEWATAIDEIHPELPIPGTQVMIQLQSIIWSYILETWQCRNTHLHHNAAQLNLPNYQQAAITLHEQCHLIPLAAQEDLFRLPLEEILELLALRLQTWMQHGLKYFNQQLQAAKTQASIHTPDIRTFFHPTQHPNDLQPP